MRWLPVLTTTALLASACIVEAPIAGTKTANRPPPAPRLDVPSGALFGEAIELAQVSIDPGRGLTGEAVKATAIFRVLKKVDSDYLVFVHVEDVDGRVDRINVDHAPARGQLPTSRWNVGDVIRDDFEIPIPPGMPVRGLSLVMGFWDPRTDQRLKVVNADKVRTDGRDRVYVAQFPVIQP